MSVSIGQILMIILILVCFFGNFPRVVKNVVNGIRAIQKIFKN
jgi:Sec-independent protein translocase protein TatA